MTMGKTLGQQVTEARPEEAKSLELLRLCRRARRDPEAAEQVMTMLLPKVQRSVTMLVGRDPETEDLVNASLLAIFEGLPRFRGESSLVVWAHRVAYRVTMRAIKRKRRRDRTVLLLDSPPHNPERDRQLTAASQLQVKQRLDEHLQRLPPERRAAIVLRAVVGLSVNEVAEVTGARVNTVRGRIRVGLSELRESIAQDPSLLEYWGRTPNG